MLRQDPDDGSRWEDPGWKGRGPATFAVVIGVSRYAHLTGDDASFGLGQLHVSALTAFRFFTWLRDTYVHSEKPLARCWLLLAPSDAEKAEEPAIPRTPLPTFDNCSAAIAEWFAAMRDEIHTVHADKSRAVFFFSGHGLEVTTDRQVLLPSDYLTGRVPLVNRALSTFNLYSGLRALPLPEHFFFLDACRNDHQALREMQVHGAEVLNQTPSHRARPDLKAPIIYATGPGAAAWQPESPKDGPSIFGRALVEGLRGAEGVGRSSLGGKTWVTFRALEDYLDPRVERLLLESGSQVKQPVRIWGPVGKLEICEVEGEPQPTGALDTRRWDDVGMAGPSVSSVAPGSWRDWSAERIAMADPALAPGPPGRVDRLVRALLAHARTCVAATGAWLTDQWKPLTEAGSLRVRSIWRDRRRPACAIEVEVRTPSAVWLQFDHPDLDQRAACVLMGAEGAHPIYMLELHLGQDDGAQRISDFDVELSGENEGLLGEAALSWHWQRAMNARESPHPPAAILLERALAAPASALAATVAALMLVRSWRHDRLRGGKWLVEVLPDAPDPCVLYAEKLLYAGVEARKALPWLLLLERRGLPQTVDGLSMAVRQIEECRRFAFPGNVERTGAEREEMVRLERIGTALDGALRTFRPGGLCATFLGRKELVTPQLMVVPRS